MYSVIIIDTSHLSTCDIWCNENIGMMSTTGILSESTPWKYRWLPTHHERGRYSYEFYYEKDYTWFMMVWGLDGTV